MTHSVIILQMESKAQEIQVAWPSHHPRLERPCWPSSAPQWALGRKPVLGLTVRQAPDPLHSVVLNRLLLLTSVDLQKLLEFSSIRCRYHVKAPGASAGGQYLSVSESPTVLQGQTPNQTLSIFAHTPHGGMDGEGGRRDVV